MNIFGIGKGQNFSKYSEVSVIKLQGKKSENQFSNLPIISGSNEPRECASHWEMSIFGIGKGQIFSKYS